MMHRIDKLKYLSKQLNEFETWGGGGGVVMEGHHKDHDVLLTGSLASVSRFIPFSSTAYNSYG